LITMTTPITECISMCGCAVCYVLFARLVFHDCFPSIGFAFRLSVLLSVPQLMPGNFAPDFWHWLLWFTTASPSNGSAKRLPWPQLPLSDMSGYISAYILYIHLHSHVAMALELALAVGVLVYAMYALWG